MPDGEKRRQLLTRAPVPEMFDPAMLEEDMRRPFRLKVAAPGQYVIVANQQIELLPPGPFTKFRITIRSAHIAYVAFEGDASPGAYDELHPGNGVLEERCEPQSRLSIMFPIVPTDDVLVVLYAGRPALPTS